MYKKEKTYSRYLFVLICILVFIVSQKWLSWDAGNKYLVADDVQLYVEMAEQAPSVEYVGKRFHIAQRFFVNSIVGNISHFSGWSVPSVFTGLTIVCSLLLIFAMHRLLSIFKLSFHNYCVFMAFFIFNPYIFRYHLLVPGLLHELFFLLGVIIIMIGLVEIKLIPIMLGCVLATFSRQTAVLLIPGIVLWVVFGSQWKNNRVMDRVFASVSTLFAVVLTYLITSYVATLSLSKSQNLDHMIGIVHWIQENGFRMDIILELTLRALMSHLMVLSLIFAVSFSRRGSQKSLDVPFEFWALLLMVIAVVSQPIMAGPFHTGYPRGNGTRLGMMGIIPMLTALFVFFKANKIGSIELKIRELLLLLGGIFLGSIHHMYSVFGPQTSKGFLALHVAACFLVFIGGSLIVKRLYIEEKKI